LFEVQNFFIISQNAHKHTIDEILRDNIIY